MFFSCMLTMVHLTWDILVHKIFFGIKYVTDADKCHANILTILFIIVGFTHHRELDSEVESKEKHGYLVTSGTPSRTLELTFLGQGHQAGACWPGTVFVHSNYHNLCGILQKEEIITEKGYKRQVTWMKIQFTFGKVKRHFFVWCRLG